MSSSFIGYIGCVIAVLCFGSNFVPAKRVVIGDGVYFQWVMCNAIFVTSIPILVIQGFPTFHPFAMLGGVLWCSGNMLCGPIIQLIGLGLGLLVWGSTNMLMGWASGTFGLFGLRPESIANPLLNYIGVGCALCGFLAFLQVKSESQSENMSSPPNDYKAISTTHNPSNLTTGLFDDDNLRLEEGGLIVEDDKTCGSSLSPTKRRILGLCMACFTGCLFGCAFDPAQYIIDNEYDGNDNSLNYVFPHFCGIVIASWGWFIIYLVYYKSMGFEPLIDRSLIIPGVISGVLWGIADIAWFFANGYIGFSVTFPIISFGPGFIGALWGIFVFQEIKGFRNLAMLCLAFCITMPGLILVALSH